MKFEYNEGQKNAINVLLDFINNIPKSDDDYFYTLEGFAGTGKSTIIKDIINKLRKKKIVVSAPTHKAKKVIANFTDLKAETIQALLGLRPNTDLEHFNPNKPVFDTKAEPKIELYDVLFIDETSLLPFLLKKLIEKLAIQFNVKVIYIGDRYQAPPVGEKISRVFLNKNRVVLDEIVRQSNENPNQELIEIARNDVRDKTDKFISFIRNNSSRINDKGEGYYLENKNEYYPNLLKDYQNEIYQNNSDFVKLLVYTNDTGKKLNTYIRKKLIDSNELIAKGDILMAYSTVSIELPRAPYYRTVIENSADYIVTDALIQIKTIGHLELKGYRTYVKDNDDPLFILHKDSYADFREEIKRRLQIATNGFGQWKQYYTFKNQITLMEAFYKADGKLLVDKDIDYGYAITTHKSQGSTYENVGININDLMTNYNADERRSLIYVAVSRTSKINRILCKTI